MLPPLSPNLVANEGATQEVAGGTEALGARIMEEGYLSGKLTALGVYSKETISPDFKILVVNNSGKICSYSPT